MEVDSQVSETVEAVETKVDTPEKADKTETVEITDKPVENAETNEKSPTKDVAKSIPTVGDHKENGAATTPIKASSGGTLAGIAAAVASNAVASAAVKKEEAKKEEIKDKSFMPGVMLQFPDMFSMKRDGHILKKFNGAIDVKMQKYAFVECESEEVAIALQAKLNNTVLNSKNVTATRLDTTEKQSLYIGGLKKEVTDEHIRAALSGVQEILREKYNTFVRFGSETECRAARAKVTKEGICDQKTHCDFDHKKDRFKQAEEPAAKKPKEDEEVVAEEEDAGKENEEATTKEATESTEETATEEAKTATEEEADEVKADDRW